jgi:murein tripeptide amidase MpaA
LRVIKIGTSNSRARKTKPAIFIDGGVHAREWVAISTALFVAYKLTTEYESDPQIAQLVDHYDWYILPVANPDGYEYTHTNDRMWRKTRSSASWGWCRGVDPNRNFDFHWNEVGASDNPCSEIYAGPRAFSEPETRAIAEFINSRRGQLKIYMALHCYSQLWLTPWGYTHKLPDNYADMEKKAKVAVQALNKRHGTEYRFGSSTHVLYAAAGGADDWAHNAGIPYTYTVELRDKGRHGFILPRQQIVPTGEETFDAISALAQEVRSTNW